jgi:ABC-type sugar transport system ATPase subunit
MQQKKLLEIRNVSKFFPGVTALDNVTFDIYKDTVHCIVGENGAGKSTLIKILTGAERKSNGQIFMNGREFSPRNTRDAMNSGMSVLFQELNVVDQLTVEENLSLGKEKKRFGFIQKDPLVIDKVYGVMHSLDPSISIQQRVAELSVAQKQVIEIAKAIASDSDVIIMDEPTAAISEDEVKRLFSIINKLKYQNVSVIYISHRLNEIFQIGDYVTVLRDGQMVGTRTIKELMDCRDEIESCAELIKMMLGKVVAEHYIPSTIDRKSTVLELKNVSTHKLKNISFKLYKGEILGFYGLIGAGKTEIAKAIYGVDRKDGEVWIDGRIHDISGPVDAIEKGMAMVPEERRSEGLFTKLAIKENVPIMNLRSISKNGIFSRKTERTLAKKYIEDLRIVARDESQLVSKLSGGNQQKVVLSKCLNAGSNILMMDEPTRGIDVGAKEEIHNLIRKLSKEGKSIIVFSSELPEILNLCDRIVLLYEGRIVKVIENGGEINSEEIMHIVTGGLNQ